MSNNNKENSINILGKKKISVRNINLGLNNQLKLNRYYLEKNSCYEVKCKNTSEFVDNIKNSMLESARLAEKGFYTKYSFKEQKLSCVDNDCGIISIRNLVALLLRVIGVIIKSNSEFYKNSILCVSVRRRLLKLKNLYSKSRNEFWKVIKNSKKK
jgi:hypothetical protein